MKLAEEQVARYQREGFLVLDSALNAQEVEQLIAAFDREAEESGEDWVVTDRSGELRAVYASHLRQPEYADLIRSPTILTPVQQLLTEEVYLYQLKVNAKAPFVGESWAWHQDYAAWRIADGLPRPRLVNVAVFLDDVSEFNGPLVFIPGSHLDPTLTAQTGRRSVRSAQHLDPEDIMLPADALEPLVDLHGMVSPKGPAGTVVLFSPEIVHGSGTNLSPRPRRLAIVTYNDVANRPVPVGPPRPEYLVGRDMTPLRVSWTGTPAR